MVIWKLRTFWFSTIAFLVMSVIFVLNYSNLPPQIPLFYSLAHGEGQIVDLPVILLIPAIMVILVNLNNLLVRKYFKDENFVERFFDYVNIFIIIFLSFIFLRIIILVG